MEEVVAKAKVKKVSSTVCFHCHLQCHSETHLMLTIFTFTEGNHSHRVYGLDSRS